MLDSSATTTGSVYADKTNVVDVSTVSGHKDLKTTIGHAHTTDERLH
jgi:hypothetical protein